MSKYILQKDGSLGLSHLHPHRLRDSPSQLRLFPMIGLPTSMTQISYDNEDELKINFRVQRNDLKSYKNEALRAKGILLDDRARPNKFQK